jgi:hypothetical protein
MSISQKNIFFVSTFNVRNLDVNGIMVERERERERERDGQEDPTYLNRARTCAYYNTLSFKKQGKLSINLDGFCSFKRTELN